MAYTILQKLEDVHEEKLVAVSQLIKLDREHVVVDFERKGYTSCDTFLFESGWVILHGTDTKVELTRILCSCDKAHDHGIYYQAPRQMELWEALFAIGELDALGAPADLDKGDDK